MLISSQGTFPLILEAKNTVFLQKIGEKLKLKRSLRHGGHVWERPKHRLSAPAGEVGPRKRLLPHRSGTVYRAQVIFGTREMATSTRGEGSKCAGLSVSVSHWVHLFVLCKKCLTPRTDLLEGRSGEAASVIRPEVPDWIQDQALDWTGLLLNVPQTRIYFQIINLK